MTALRQWPTAISILACVSCTPGNIGRQLDEPPAAGDTGASGDVDTSGDTEPNGDTGTDCTPLTCGGSSVPVLSEELCEPPEIAQPAKCSTHIDPDFNTPVRRITDIADDTGDDHAFLQYSRYTQVSSDGRYLIVSGAYLYDLTDCSFVKPMPHINGSDRFEYPNGALDAQPDYRWDYSGDHPTRVYYRFHTTLHQVDVETEEHDDLYTFDKDEFPTAVVADNRDEGDSSADSRYWAFMLRDIAGELVALAVYDKESSSIVGRLTEENMPLPNHIDMSPSGDAVYVGWEYCSDEGSPYCRPRAYARDFSTSVVVGGDPNHSGWAFDKDGKEGLVRAYMGDYVTWIDVATGDIKRIKYHPSFGGWDVHWHFGRFYGPGPKGWVLMSTYDADHNEWADNQLLMLEIVDADAGETPRVWRIAHTMNDRGLSGSVSPRASLNIQGTKVWWAGNWNTGTTEIYEATLPREWWTALE